MDAYPHKFPKCSRTVIWKHVSGGFLKGTDNKVMTSTSRANIVLACAAVTCDSENQSLVNWIHFRSRQDKGLAAVGWSGVVNVNIPWLGQGRLVAIFRRDPDEAQARSRRDQKFTQIPATVVACVSSIVFSAHVFSLFQPSRSRAHCRCLRD